MPNGWRGVLLTAVILLEGCGAPEAPVVKKRETSAESAAPKRYAAEDLPKVDEPLPPLDGGKVQIAPPKGWKPLSREATSLARFVKGKPNELPRIVVTGLPAGGIKDVTDENVSEFVEERQKWSASQKGRKLLEPVRPIILGDHTWARHVRYVEFSGSPAALQALETAHGGRLYLIELTVKSAGRDNEAMAKAILADRNAAYAVAANWKFLDEPGAVPAETPPAETTKAAVPAEPAGEKPAPEKTPEENPAGEKPAEKPADARP